MAGKRVPARPRHPGPGRVERVRDVLQREGWDALAVTSLPNVRWLSGYTGSSAVMLVGKDGSWFVTDFRYQSQVRDEVRGSEVEIAGKGLPQSLAAIARRGGYRKLAVEADFLTLRALAELRAGLPKRIEIVHARDVVGTLRMVKDRAEIEAIRRAVDLAAEAYDSVVPLLRPGTSERDVALEVDTRMRKLGAEGSSFPTIVASGWRSALPHGRPTEKKLLESEFVIVDMGAALGGYCSDMTRTVWLGRRPDPDARAIYDCVRKAQERCAARVRPGMTAHEADRIARDVIEKAGYGAYFGHGTGHGIGLEVHEGPRLHQSAPDLRLQPGMVFSVEPGIYVPGLGGVRIEDLVVLRAEGAEVLTPNTRKMLCL